MKHLSFLPKENLRPFVRSFVVSETVPESTYYVLPDTGIVIGFQYRGRLHRIDGDQQSSLSISGVSGLTDQRRTFKNSADIGTVLVFFREAGAAQFFKHPLNEIFRESVSLDNFMLRAELLSLEETLAESRTDEQRVDAVEDFLTARMRNIEPDKLVLAALALIHKSSGNIRIKDLMDQLHISQSPLEKRFRQAVGTSPKKFASIVRLRNAIQNYDPNVSLTELSHEAGFYDQAHFIKEFKTFAGETPEKFFSGKK